jgi:hypothetical protein
LASSRPRKRVSALPLQSTENSNALFQIGMSIIRRRE